ncbi:MAG: ABC transporter substrate-binding protein [Nitrospinales bacterium]
MQGKWKIVFALGVFLLAGCGSPGREAELGKTVHYYQFSLPRADAAFSRLVELFNRQYPDITIRVHTLPQTTDDQHQFYLTHLRAGAGSRIDVFAIDVIWLAEFARAEILMPLDPEFAPDEWRRFFPSAVRAATYGGERFAVPFFVDGGVLYSRRDLLEKYGYRSPPATYGELIRIARSILEKENDPALHGFVWQGRQYEGLVCDFIEFLPASAEPLLARRDGALNFDQPAVRDTLQFMRDLVVKHRITPASVFAMAEEESRHVFHNGKAIFMRNWPYAWRLAQAEGSPVAGKIQVSPLPARVEGQESRSALGGFLLGINRRTPNPDAAIAWARFLVSDAAQEIIRDQLGLTPAKRHLVSRLGNADLSAIMERTVPRPVTPVYNAVSQSMQAYISGALAGVYSIDRSVRLAENDARRILRVMNFETDR